MTQKTRRMSATRIAGWVLSGLIAAFLLFSATGKLTELMPRDQKEKMFAHLGWAEETMKAVGVVEVVIVLLYLFPPTGFVGAILMTGYLGAASAAHVRVGDPVFEFSLPIVLGVVAWVAYGLRNPTVFRLALGKEK